MFIMSAQANGADETRSEAEVFFTRHIEECSDAWTQGCSSRDENQVQLRTSALSSTFVVMTDNHPPITAQWRINGKKLVLEGAHEGRHAGASAGEELSLVFEIVEKNTDSLSIVPATVFGIYTSRSSQANGVAPKREVSVTEVKAYPKNLILLLKGGVHSGSQDKKVNIVKLPDIVMESRRNEPESPYADVAGGYSATDCRYFNCSTSDSSEKDNDSILRWRVERISTIHGPQVQQPLVIHVDSETPMAWRPYVRKGIEEWNRVFKQAGYPGTIVVRQLPDGFSDYDDVRYTVLCWGVDDGYWVEKERRERKCTSGRVVDPRSGEILQQRIGTGGLFLVPSYVVSMGGLDDRLKERYLPIGIAGDLVSSIAAHETGHLLGLRDGSYGGGSLQLGNVRSPQWIERSGFAQSIMNYTRFNILASSAISYKQSALIQSLGPADYYWLAWGYGDSRECLESGAPEMASCESRPRAEMCDDKCRRFFGGRPMWADPYGVHESLPVDDPITASIVAVENLRAGVNQAFSRSFSFVPSVGDLNDVVSPRVLYSAAVNKWLDTQLQVASIPGAVSPFCEKNNELECNWNDIEKDAMRHLELYAFSVPDFLLAEDVLEKAGLSREEAMDVAAGSHPTLLSILLAPHRVKELARRSGMRSQDRTDDYDLSLFLADIHDALSSGTQDYFTSRMKKQYLQHLAQLVDAFRGDSDSAAATASDLISHEIELIGSEG